MLSNAYFLAKFRFDTAKNEPAKNCKILLISPNFRFSGRGRPDEPAAADVAATVEPDACHGTVPLERRLHLLCGLCGFDYSCTTAWRTATTAEQWWSACRMGRGV